MACTENELLEKNIIKKYKDVVMDMLPLNFPGLNRNDLEQAVNNSIQKRFKNSEVELYNSYTDKRMNTTLLDVAEYIIKREPILCANGVMFKKHAECRNPLINLISSYLDSRKKAKKKMFTFPKGSEDFERYNLLQLLYKIDTNSLYGLRGRVKILLKWIAPSL